MSNTSVNSGGNESNDAGALSPDLSSPAITSVTATSNDSSAAVVISPTTHDLLSLPQETLAKLFMTAISNNPSLASSMFPREYITEAKIRAKDLAERRLPVVTKFYSSQEGFSPNLALSSSKKLSLNTKSFRRFSELPAELRVKIWEFAFLEPRLVKLSSSYSNEPDARLAIRSGTRVPVTFHINQESRAEALKYFQPLFKSTDQEQKIYCNFNADIICFQYRSARQRIEFLDRLFALGTENIQRFACSYNDSYDFLQDDRCSFMRNFPALREVFTDAEMVCTKFLEQKLLPLSQQAWSMEFHAFRTKIECMEKGVWVHWKEAGFNPKGLDSRIFESVRAAAQKYPEWKPPTFSIGAIYRRELNEKIAEQEKATAEIVADSQKYLATLEPAERQAALEKFQIRD